MLLMYALTIIQDVQPTALQGMSSGVLSSSSVWLAWVCASHPGQSAFIQQKQEIFCLRGRDMLGNDVCPSVFSEN
jgi:hypothetical protein